MNNQMKELEKFNKMQFDKDIKDFLKLKNHSTDFIVKESFFKTLIHKTNAEYIKMLAFYKFFPHPLKMMMPQDWMNILYERHHFYSNDKNENERISLQKDENYIKRLVNEVVLEVVSNAHLGKVSSNMPISSSPEISRLMMVINVLYEIWKKIEISSDHHKAIKLVFERALEQLKAMIILMEYKLVAEIITIWRSFYETELTLIILSYWPESVAKEYLTFLEFMEIENNVVVPANLRAEIEEKLKEKVEQRSVKRSKNFINYGWIMQTTEYTEKKCKLSIKEGLAILADTHMKYNDYQMASTISHASLFTKYVEQFDLYVFAVESVINSLSNLIEPLEYIFEKFQIKDEKNFKIVNDSIDLLFEMKEIYVKIKIRRSIDRKLQE